MVTAIVCIQADRNSIPQTAEQICTVPHVAEVYSVTGSWDIIAIIRMPSYDDLDNVVTHHLRKLSGIVRTETMLAFRTYDKNLLDQSFNLGLEDEKI